MKTAIIGASGFLGTKLVNILSKDYELIEADINPSKNTIQLDATKKEEVRNFFLKYKPDIVIDTVALTSSLECEKNPKQAYKINYLTAKNIADSCKRVGARMVFISSSYIFDGKKGNYREEDSPHPLNEYGKTKLMAENEVLKLRNSIILRVDVMYGYNGKDKPNGVFSKILSGQEMKLRDIYQIRQPLFVDDVAAVITEIISKKQSGIFHTTGPDRLKMIDFLSKLERIVRDESKISVSQDDSPSTIQIPKNCSMDISKIKSLGIKTHSFEEGLRIMKEQISEEKD